MRFLSDAERDALLEACGKAAWPALAALVLLAISTGARRGELIRLKWRDVDLKTARATVNETKNDDSCVLPLVGKTLTALRALKLQGSAQSEWVFQQPSGFRGPYENFDDHWYAALKPAGIENCRFEIADVLGHKTMAMVRRCSHLAAGHKTTIIERMAKERGL